MCFRTGFDLSMLFGDKLLPPRADSKAELVKIVNIHYMSLRFMENSMPGPVRFGVL